VSSSLDGIPGVGPGKKKALLRQFRSIEALKAASEAELCAAEGIGPALAKAIHEHFHPQKGGEA